jgi:hypothetical protein
MLVAGMHRAMWSFLDDSTSYCIDTNRSWRVTFLPDGAVRWEESRPRSRSVRSVEIWDKRGSILEVRDYPNESWEYRC